MVALPTVGVLAAIHQNNVSVRSSADVDRRAEVRHAARLVEEMLVASVRAFDEIVSFPGLNSRECAPLLARLPDVAGQHLAVVDVDGSVVCDSYRGASAGGVAPSYAHLGGLRLATAAVAAGVIGPYHDPLTGMLSVAVVQTLDAGDLITELSVTPSYLVGVQDLVAFSTDTADALDTDLLITALDVGAGVVALRTNDPQRWVGEQIANHSALIEAATELDTYIATPVDGGADRLFATVILDSDALAGLDWKIFAGKDLAFAFADANHRNRDLLTFYGILLATTVGLAVLFGHNIVRPLRVVFGAIATDATAEVLRAGTGVTELDRLAASFDHAARRRNLAEEALMISEERFLALVSNSPDLTAVLDEPTRIAHISPASRAMLGAEPAGPVGPIEQVGPVDHVGTPAADLAHPEGRACLIARIRQRRPGSSCDNDALGLSAGLCHLRHAISTWHHVKTAPHNHMSTLRAKGKPTAGHDIIGHIEMQSELARSETLHRSLTEAVGDLVALVSDEWEYAYVNPSVTRILGWEPHDLVGLSVGDFLHPEDVDRVRERFSQRLATEQDRSAPTWAGMTYRVRHLDGSYRVLETVASERLDSAEVTGVVVSSRDVTASRAAEERFGALVEYSSDVICIFDAKGYITYVSSAVGHVLGYTAAELVGRDASDFFHPEDYEDAHALLAEMVAAAPGERRSVRARVRHADGSWRAIEGSVCDMMTSEAIGGFVANFRDVTEPLAAAAQLHRSEARFRSLVAQSTDLTLLIDPETLLVTYASPAASTLLGVDPAELEGTNPLGIVHPEDTARLLDSSTWNLRPGVPSQPVEYRIHHANGTWRKHVAVITDFRGVPAVAGVVVNIRDVTERHVHRLLTAEYASLMELVAAGTSFHDIAASAVAMVEHYANGHCAVVERGPVTSCVIAAPSSTDADIVASLSTVDLSAVRLPSSTGAERDVGGGWRLLVVHSTEHPEPDEHGEPDEHVEPDEHGDQIALLVRPGPTGVLRTDVMHMARHLLAAAVERDRINQNLRRSEERFRWAFHGSPVGLGLVSSSTGEFFAANPALVALLGYQDKGLVGVHWRDVVGATEIQDAAAELGSGEPLEVERDYVRADGTTFIGVGRISTVEDQEHARSYVVQLQDITARHNAAQEIFELNEMLVVQLGELDAARAQLQSTLSQVTNARELERRSLAVALHGDAIQTLIATQWNFESMLASLGIPEEDHDAAAVSASLRSVVDALRRQTFDLMPPALELGGLHPALEQLIAHIDASVEPSPPVALHCDLPGRFASGTETLVYRIAQEALANVVRHAQAATATVDVRLDDVQIVVRITDDGVGAGREDMERRAREGHIGIPALRESVRSAGGTLALRSTLGKGTTVEVRLPAPPDWEGEGTSNMAPFGISKGATKWQDRR